MEKKVRFCPASVLYLILAILSSFSIIAVIVAGNGVFGSILGFLFQLYFCIILFMKKRELPVFIALGLLTLGEIVNKSVFGIIIYGLLFVLALSACDKPVIKTNFFKKIYFVPAILMIVNLLWSIIINISYIGIRGVVIGIFSWIIMIIEIIAVFSLGKWLAYPFANGEAAPAAEEIPASAEEIAEDAPATETEE